MNPISISALTSIHSSYEFPNKGYTSQSNQPTQRTDILTVSEVLQANAASATNRHNEVSISPGNVYSLGSINGKPLRFSLQNGLLETNFSPLIRQSAPGSSVSAYQMEAAQHFRSYTDEEHRQANQIIGRLHDLLDLTENKMSVDQYNARESFPYVSSTKHLLEQLGVDISKAFTINGVRYEFHNGVLTKL